MTFLSPPTASAGEKFPAGWWNAYVRNNANHLFQAKPNWLHIDRTDADFIKNNDTTFEAIPRLAFSIGANENWIAFVILHYVSNTSADIVARWTTPTGASGRWGFAAELDARSDPIGAGIAWSTSGNDQTLLIFATIANGANAGTVQLDAKQDTAHASDTKIYKHSAIKAIRIF